MVLLQCNCFRSTTPRSTVSIHNLHRHLPLRPPHSETKSTNPNAKQNVPFRVYEAIVVMSCIFANPKVTLHATTHNVGQQAGHIVRRLLHKTEPHGRMERSTSTRLGSLCKRTAMSTLRCVPRLRRQGAFSITRGVEWRQGMVSTCRLIERCKLLADLFDGFEKHQLTKPYYDTLWAKSKPTWAREMQIAYLERLGEGCIYRQAYLDGGRFID